MLEFAVGAAHVGADPAGRHQDHRAGVAGMAGGEAAHERVQRRLAGAVDLAHRRWSLLATLPWPDDMIADACPSGGTRSCSASITRIGLSALVTITRTNSSVETSAIVSSGSLVTPALTNSRSKRRPARRVAQGRDLVGLADVDGLDFEPALGGVGEVVQRRPRAAAHRRDDVASRGADIRRPSPAQGRARRR